MTSRLNIGHVILLFALAALPFAATYALYYPDERHYTDGALQMLQGHGWLIPKNSDGTPRFEKPPLAYWVIAASWTVFGVGVLASKLPFLLAGCGTLFLTHRIAKKLTGNSESALLAAIVLASQPQFFLCSLRSMPDALLVFFITLSAHGFLRLIVFEEFSATAFWAAYGGAALAVLDKGLLGGLIIVFAWAFAVWQRRDWRAIKKIIHPPVFFAAAILAGSWFAYIFWKDGALAWRHFFGDQVTGNIHGHFWSPFFRVPQFALVLIFNFLPWSAPVVEWFARRKSFAAGNVPLPAQKFILAWTTILVVGFSFGSNVSLRYLLPATPLMAVPFAAWLQNANAVPLIFSTRRIFKIALVVLIFGDALAFFIESQWPLSLMISAFICGLLLLGIAALGLGVRRQKFSAAFGLGLAALLLWLIIFSAALPILLPDCSQQIAAVLKQAQTIAPKKVLLVGNVQLASRVRVLLGKNWTVVQTDKLDPAMPANFKRILIPDNELFKFVGSPWKIQTAGMIPAMPSPRKLWIALKSRRLPEALVRSSKKICLVTRP
jgi:4-amino-4-deoxy-L-arabinose transferase-like glycosyltransferase